MAGVHDARAEILAINVSFVNRSQFYTFVVSFDGRMNYVVFRPFEMDNEDEVIVKKKRVKIKKKVESDDEEEQDDAIDMEVSFNVNFD
ncbi:unnamed protein product [Cylicostephanus goldi]|uniref:Uncharacterized protein n=1 Tax=Cylicostephanus goldi TaxID=71465 RepID=A0A3P6QMZ9_CYLGO|nr:unnamed protein product [Cylicostephanus goldi]